MYGQLAVDASGLAPSRCSPNDIASVDIVDVEETDDTSRRIPFFARAKPSFAMSDGGLKCSGPSGDASVFELISSYRAGLYVCAEYVV